jgi:hypothetical protein
LAFNWSFTFKTYVIFTPFRERGLGDAPILPLKQIYRYTAEKEEHASIANFSRPQ